MEIRHLKYFKILCEELNFTRAARRLNISQPPLTRQIHDLENELGAELFTRTYHKLELTKEGEILREYADRILSLADEAVSKVASEASEKAVSKSPSSRTKKGGKK